MTIHEFAQLGDIDSVASELKDGMHVDARDDHDRTPLACASESPHGDVSVVLFLIESGADVNASINGAETNVLGLAACSGSLDKVQLLIESGANIHFASENGYTVLTNIIYKLHDDERLVPMIELLTKLGADTDCETSYGESPLSVSSCFGRFDAVRALLDAGADPSPLQWTNLMKAAALGTIDEVEQLLINDRSSIHERDRWERTPWLLACVAGDIDKAKRILAAGADLTDRERMGPAALGICASKGHSELLSWLLDVGVDVEAVDDAENTALMLASQEGETECVQTLLEAGANPKRKNEYGDSTMSLASSEAVMRLLLGAGESITEINTELKHEILGLDGCRSLKVAEAEYQSGCRPRYGKANPEVMNVPLWHEMVRTGISAYEAKTQFGDEGTMTEPTWCYSRFGVSFTELPDGRFVQIGGEHEDYYDPDFYIYNDVLVHERGGHFQIMGYPREVFPPTDFHSATYFDGAIYIIGGLGYHGSRQFGTTPIYRLDCESWKIEPFESSGDNPGWIYEHTAHVKEEGVLVIASGKLCVEANGEENHIDNDSEFTLDVRSGAWSRA